MRRHTPVLLMAAALSIGALSACSSSSSDGAKATTTQAKTSTTVAHGPLKILVTNDDGVGAPGINELVKELKTLDNVELTVIAPLANKSGTGGHTTTGPLETKAVTMDVGQDATAVVGFPADTVRYAMDDKGLKPDLVVSGNNFGQNLSPMVDLSGTIGAARAGATRGVPALAISQGLGKVVDYPAAAPFILDWIKQHRAAIEAGTEKAQVTSLNVPSCSSGEIRGLMDISSKPDDVLTGALAPQDCASTTPKAKLTNDVDAFKNGFATIAVVPNQPAS